MARYAVSDIHGCLKTFKALIFNKILLTKSDRLYLLGDFINKGPDSKGVLDFIAELQMEGFQVQCLRGNHDQMLLDVQLGNVAGSWLHEPQKRVTLESFGLASPNDIPEKYLLQISSMPYFIELDHFFLVHAGFYLGMKNPFYDTVSMMNIKKFSYDRVVMKGKRIVHGHLPQLLPDIERMVSCGDRIIKIDGGCVYYTSEGYGNLIGLDLDQLSVYVQPNVDQPYEVGLRQK